MKVKGFVFLLLAWLTLPGCNSKSTSKIGNNYRDSFFSYIKKGDEVYAAKKGYNSFEQSLKYYDKAERIAETTNDTLLLAEAIFAKGRVYDAWNKEPQVTIQKFKQASSLFATIPTSYKRYLYTKHLIAHAYDKIHDSANASTILHELYVEIRNKDSAVKKHLPFSAEMALIATEVHNYDLADSILTQLTKRAWISNDPDTYDYLNHYYLSQSRLDVYHRHLKHSLFADSLYQVFIKSSNILDKMYYSSNLAELYAAEKNFQSAYKMLGIAKVFTDSLNNTVGVSSMQNALLKSELLAEKRRQEYQDKLRQTWVMVVTLLTALLAIITILSVFLQKQRKKYLNKSNELEVSNKLLDEKVRQVELLYKEIQHRIKNNLHMVFSLLQMQERRSQNEETINNLQSAMLRIESISSLHNELVNSNDRPNLNKHIKELVMSAVNCLANDRKVVTHLSIEATNLKLKHYLPVSLILNEWITNSIKYARIPDGLLELNISLKNETNITKLIFSDNGAMIEKQPAGLGTQIIKMLCRQLNGKLETLSTHSYHYLLTIQDEE